MTPVPDVPSERLEDAVSYLRYVADGIDPDGRVQLLLNDYDERGLAVERLTNEVDVLTEYHAAEIERLRGALRAMARRSVHHRRWARKASAKAQSRYTEYKNLLNKLGAATGVRVGSPSHARYSGFAERICAVPLRLRAENAELRADLAAAQAQCDELRTQVAGEKHSFRVLNIEYQAALEKIGEQYAELRTRRLSFDESMDRIEQRHGDTIRSEAFDDEPWGLDEPSAEDLFADLYRQQQERLNPAPVPDPAPAESQPVQVREAAARRLRAAASIIGLAPDVSLTGTARWIEEALSVPDAERVARVLVPAEVDNPVRIADRIRGLQAVQVLKQLVDAIEDDHAGDMTPLWAEARRVLGETPSDPVACTCRPIFGGLDVDEHCPSHGWKS